MGENFVEKIAVVDDEEDKSERHDESEQEMNHNCRQVMSKQFIPAVWNIIPIHNCVITIKLKRDNNKDKRRQ